MKKSRIVVAFLLLLTAILLVVFNFAPPIKVSGDIEVMTVRNGTTGDRITITDEQEIDAIAETIQGFDLRRGKSPKPGTGWRIALDLQERNSERIMRLELRQDGIVYNNSYYGKDDRVAQLLNQLEEMFEQL